MIRTMTWMSPFKTMIRYVQSTRPMSLLPNQKSYVKILMYLSACLTLTNGLNRFLQLLQALIIPGPKRGVYYECEYKVMIYMPSGRLNVGP